jgi:hypothetical protein
MINIFEVFLPQLLRYPNPNDPLNGEAAALLMRHPKEYDAKVKGSVILVFFDLVLSPGAHFRGCRVRAEVCDERSRGCCDGQV